MNFRKPLVAVTFGFVTAIGHATPPSTASIETLLEVTRTKLLVEEMPALIQPTMRIAMAEAIGDKQLTPKRQEAMARFQQKFLALMREELSWDVLGPMYVQVYTETFTQEEVDAFVEFYRTPAGKALIEKMPLVMARTQSIMSARIAPLIEKMKRAAAEAAAEPHAAPQTK